MKKYILPVALIALCFGGCRAEDDILQGELGEFCNGSDDDCRDGLVCIQGACELPGPQPIYSCDEICARLAACDAEPASCVGNCRATIADWSLRAKNEFAVCAVDDISCEEAQNNPVPQYCYSRIELTDQRRERCDSFGRTVLECDRDADATSVVGACYAIGRTGSDEAWNATDRCVNAQETGICSGFATCLNETLDVSITLPDNG